MKRLLIFILTILALIAGCEPISVNEPPPDKDIVVDFLSLVTPDTVEQNVPTPVKFSFPKVCGGTYSRLITTYDTLGDVFLQPIIHKVGQQNCPGNLGTQTVSATVTFSQVGTSFVGAIGNYSSFRKYLTVVAARGLAQNYKLQFHFQDRAGSPHILYQSAAAFNTPAPPQQFTIVTDSLGNWDTTFTSSSSSFNYTIGGYQFTANRGVTEDGIIIIP